MRLQNLNSCTLGYAKCCIVGLLLLSAGLLHAELAWDKAGVDFGKVSGHRLVKRTLNLKSHSDKVTKITDVIKTCTCADLDVSSKDIPPQGEVILTFTLDPNIFAGPFRKTFYLRTDDPDTPSIRIPVSGNVRPWWTVSPSRDQSIPPKKDTVSFEISSALDAPELVNVSVDGPDGANVEIVTNESKKVVCVFHRPVALTPGWHKWKISLSASSEDTYPLNLSVSCADGRAWITYPRIIRFNAENKDKSASFILKPAKGDVPIETLNAAKLEVSPVMDGVVIVKDGEATFHGQPMKISIPGEHLTSWKTDKVFHITIPDAGTADLAVKLNRKGYVE